MSDARPPTGSLAGRTAIVTGASRGVGAAIAQRFAAEGADLLLVARTAERHEHLPGSLVETQRRCAASGGRVEVLPADLSDPRSRATIVPHALECFGGRVDVLVNNAAAAIYHPTLELSLKRRRIMFEVNVHAPVDLIGAAVPAMAEQGEGWVVNLTSASARPVGGPPFSHGGVAGTVGVYAASKAALDRITNAIGAELDGTGIRVNAVAPRAAVHTEGADTLLGDGYGDDLYEPMEALVEAVLALSTCDPARTATIGTSLDLLAELGRSVRGLDGQPR